MKFPSTGLTTALLITVFGVSSAVGQTVDRPAQVQRPTVGAELNSATNGRRLNFCARRADGPYCDNSQPVLHQCVGGRDSPQACPSGCDAETKKCVAAPTVTEGSGLR